jgi:hypothetical protein
MEAKKKGRKKLSDKKKQISVYIYQSYIDLFGEENLKDFIMQTVNNKVAEIKALTIV